MVSNVSSTPATFVSDSTPDASGQCAQADIFLRSGAELLEQTKLRQAKQVFEKATAACPILARNVADFYDTVGDLPGTPPEKARTLHETAKSFYKKLMRVAPPTQFDSRVFQADALCRIGDQYSKLSRLGTAAYNSGDTDKAIACYTDAINLLGEDKMEAAYHGRFIALARRMGHNAARSWYHPGEHFDPQLLQMVWQDFNILLGMSGTAAALVTRFATAESLFRYAMDDANQALVHQQIVPQMGIFLQQAAADEATALVQDAVLKSFTQLLRSHGWSTPTVAPYLRAFLSTAAVRRNQLEPLIACYGALLQGNKESANEVVEDLKLMSEQFCSSGPALLQIIDLAQEFIDLADALPEIETPLVALEAVKSIGVSSHDADALERAMWVLARTAQTYPNIASAAIDALADMAIAQDTPQSGHGAFVRGTVLYHLENMIKIAHLQGAVRLAMFEKLGVQMEDRLAADVLPPAIPPAAAAVSAHQPNLAAP